MTAPRSWFVVMPESMTAVMLDLESKAIAALRRSRKLPPGDRTEAIRFESIHGVIDQLAVAAIMRGEPTAVSPVALDRDPGGISLLRTGQDIERSVPAEVARWLSDGRLVVELCLPHSEGDTEGGGELGIGPPPVSARWKSTVDNVPEAVRERFESLLSAALSDPNSLTGVIRPSDVSNTVLTECLRRHSQRLPNSSRVDLRVTYRDGSEGPRFPLRAFDMSDAKPEGWRLLRFTLMSIRHVEMDVFVDGAWLRNSKVSRPRPAGLTDQMVFETSCRQLQRLVGDTPTLIYMYQTGLEPAIVGFYRAVVSHLIEHPGTIAVIPCYFRGDDKFEEGTIWRTR